MKILENINVRYFSENQMHSALPFSNIILHTSLQLFVKTTNIVHNAH